MSNPDLQDVTVGLSQVGVDLAEEFDLSSLDLIDQEVEGPLYYGDVPQLNLNALAIGLGLENIEYEPEAFPGLVYRPPQDCTLYLFEEGVIATWTAASQSVAESAIQDASERLIELGLVSLDDPPATHNLPLT